MRMVLSQTVGVNFEVMTSGSPSMSVSTWLLIKELTFKPHDSPLDSLNDFMLQKYDLLNSWDLVKKKQSMPVVGSMCF
jgi:hypothetical protein